MFAITGLWDWRPKWGDIQSHKRGCYEIIPQAAVSAGPVYLHALTVLGKAYRLCQYQYGFPHSCYFPLWPKGRSNLFFNLILF